MKGLLRESKERIAIRRRRRMRLVALNVAFLAFAAPVAATTYHLTTAGTGITFIDGWAVGGLTGPMPLLPPPPVSFAWAGTIDISTAASADGIYTGTGLTSFNAQAAILGPRPAYAIFGFNLNPYGGGDFAFFDSSPVVTVSGGLITSIVATARYLPGPTVSFNGTGIGYDGFIWHAGTTHSGGIATNYIPIPPVPEPETWAILLAGLGILTTIKRRAAP